MELTAEEAWSRILDRARARLPEQSFRTWLAPTRAIGLSEDQLVVAAPSDFAVEWLEDKFSALLGELVRAVLGDTFTLAFEARPSGRDEASPFESVAPAHLREGMGTESAATEPARAPRPAIGSLNPRYTLDSFVVGSNSELAAAASQAVAAEPGRVYNPLFIYGGVGLGKTHLMHAIGNAVLCKFPGTRVAYLPTEQFTNELVAAIQARRTSQFHSRYRAMDVLLVDDAHFLAGKERTQEEFFHTFNALYDSQKQIVLTSDRPPKEIAGLQERLVSRFEWGLVTDIRPPDFETRLAILQAKAERDQLAIDHEVLTVIADRCRSSVRELEGALIKLLALSSLSRRQLTRDLAEHVLSSSTPMTAGLTAERIEAVVARALGVTPADLRSRSRARRVVAPRQIAMYLEKKLLDLPYTGIGARFGGRDHSTVIHAIQKIERALEHDGALQAQIQHLRQQLS